MTFDALPSIIAMLNEYTVLEESYIIMLSGMSPKPNYAALVDAWVDAGGEVTKIKSRKVRKHSLRSKSHQMGGRFSRYNVGGNNRVAADRKSS